MFKFAGVRALCLRNKLDTAVIKMVTGIKNSIKSDLTLTMSSVLKASVIE